MFSKKVVAEDGINMYVVYSLAFFSKLDKRLAANEIRFDSLSIFISFNVVSNVSSSCFVIEKLTTVRKVKNILRLSINLYKLARKH